MLVSTRNHFLVHTSLNIYTVVWKITPLFASWITLPTNVLFKHDVLRRDSTVLELGCGISGIIGLSLGPRIESYTLTDQDYVMKLLNLNLTENRQDPSASSKGRRSTTKSKRGSAAANSTPQNAFNVTAKTLDWEADQVTTSLADDGKVDFDVVIACDCIYNDALIEPLVQTCIDVCQLRSSDENSLDENRKPTVCVVAQQLRSAEVFEAWLKAFHGAFKVWRMPDEELINGLKSDSGFVIHVGILR